MGDKKVLKKKAAAQPAFQRGRPGNNTAIILSAPGSAEEAASKPAAGQTGTNLNMFLEIANKKDSRRFPSKNKDDYTIVNASDQVHYAKKTGLTEAKDGAILHKPNVDRVRRAIVGKNIVVALGVKAQKVVKKIAGDMAVVEGPHPAMGSLNRKYKSEEATPTERHKDRVRKYAAEVLKKKTKKK